MLESMISKPEADYYRKKIELQANRYQDKNKELRKLNKRIRDKSILLARTNSAFQQNIMVLSRLISILSHDVRSPIANVVQTLNLINNKMLDLDESRGILIELENNGKRVLGFIHELLEWISEEKQSRIEHLDLKIINVIPVLSSVVDLYNSIAQYKDIKVDTAFSESVVEAMAEPNALKIVMRNLLGNAVKYTPPKGSIIVEAFSEENQTIIKVQDTGIGLDQNSVNKLQSGKLLAPLINGEVDSYGLGLQLCFHYIKMLNGVLSIESEPNRGTCIKITLPMN
jgi:signal transduction histidine kinase